MSNQKKKLRNAKFFKIAIPSVLSMWLFTVYSMVDGIFVAKGVGETGLAAVNIAMPLINIAFALAILWAVGASTKASIYKGQGNRQQANHVFTLSTVTTAGIGVVFTIVTLLNLDAIAVFLGSSSATHVYVKDYLGMIALFFPFYITSYNFEVLIKADGFARKAVSTVLFAACINITLDYLLVIHYDFGIKGAAFATGFSQLMSFMIFMYHFCHKPTGFRFATSPISIKQTVSLAKYGVADSMTEFSIASITFMFNYVILRHIGTEGIVIFTVICYVYQLVLMTMMGLNQAMQPLVSYHYGRGDKKCCQSLLKTALITAGICSLSAFILAQIYPAPLLSLFIDNVNSALFNQAQQAFLLFSVAYLPLGFVIIFYGYFTATARVRFAISLSLSRGWLFVIASLLIMPKLFGDNGIWLALTLSESCALLFAILLFRRMKRAAHAS